MSTFAGTLQLAVFAAIGFSLVAALLSWVAYPGLRGHLLKLPASMRAKLLSLWAALPVLSGVVLTALCFLPSLLGDDHCTSHEDVHAHFCLMHPMSSLGIIEAWYVIFAVVGIVGALLLKNLLALWSSARALRALRRLSQYDTLRGIYIVESSSCFALSSGLGRASIYLSSALLQKLQQPYLNVVIAHEDAHLHRKDGLRILLVSWLSCIHLPKIRRQLLADISLSCEQACDEYASQKLGDRIQVAEAIIAVARLLQAQPPQAAVCSFIGGDINARVESLLDPYPTTELPRGLLVLLSALLLIASDPLHHLAEDFWHLLLMC